MSTVRLSMPKESESTPLVGEVKHDGLKTWKLLLVALAVVAVLGVALNAPWQSAQEGEFPTVQKKLELKHVGEDAGPVRSHGVAIQASADSSSSCLTNEVIAAGTSFSSLKETMMQRGCGEWIGIGGNWYRIHSCYEQQSFGGGTELVHLMGTWSPTSGGDRAFVVKSSAPNVVSECRKIIEIGNSTRDWKCSPAGLISQWTEWHRIVFGSNFTFKNLTHDKYAAYETAIAGGYCPKLQFHGKDAAGGVVTLQLNSFSCTSVGGVAGLVHMKGFLPVPGEDFSYYLVQITLWKTISPGKVLNCFVGKFKSTTPNTNVLEYGGTTVYPGQGTTRHDLFFLPLFPHSWTCDWNSFSVSL